MIVISGAKNNGYEKQEKVNTKMEQTVKNRNVCLNAFEVLACIMIIFVHISFTGIIGEFITGLARFGVPLFFVIAGYYLLSDNITVEKLRQKLVKRIKRVLILILVSFLVYFSLRVIRNINTLSEYFSDNFTKNNIISLLIFNRPIFNTPTWFLLAMLYSYAFIYVFSKPFLKNHFLIIFFTCLTFVNPIIRFIVLQTKWTIFSLNLSFAYLYRNWFFCGLPFICLGVLLKKNKNFFHKIDLRLNVVLMILFFILGGCEYLLYRKMFDINFDILISNIVCVTFIMIFAQKQPELFSGIKCIKDTGTWTMLVYIIHPAVIEAIRYVVGGKLPDYVLPIAVVINTVIIVSVICYILRIIKNRRQNVT